MIEDINIPSIKLEEKAINRAVFVVEPCFPGYGTTLGNSLRRVLLSSLPGAAIIAVKIAGVDHEFSPVIGVKEDAVGIILNLKKLRFIMHEAGPVALKYKGGKTGEITGADLEIPSTVTLVNPEQYIATVSEKTALEMEIQVAKGRGYMPSEAMDEKNFSIGTIAVDAAFSPVVKVMFNVEPTRVGEMINYDKLTINVLTDGTITPEEAVRQSAQILAKQLTVFGVDLENLPIGETPTEAEAVDVKDFSIDEVNLSVRTTNALVNNGIKKVSEILEVGAEKLGTMKGLGAKALDEITDKLAELGIKFNNPDS
ncbi:MAG: DNA-directed RNA polymerase subunit alpha [Patescibacteria group bacterium]|jgi:DNA-directed RNA polymerase subunit alpha